MKDLIVMVATIALGIFVGGLIDDFKAPAQTGVTNAVTSMNSYFTP